MPADQADRFLESENVVFGLRQADAVRAYRQKVLVWHEIVNDELGGAQLSITYCPLTGSAVAFRGRSKVDGALRTFGTMGRLVNSKLVAPGRLPG